VQSVDSEEAKEITVGAAARYLTTGHLVYSGGGNLTELNGNLMAVPFDLKRLEIAGDPVLMIENVSGIGGCRFAVSDTGTLAYMPGTSINTGPIGRTLVWVDHEGNEEELAAQPRLYRFPSVSPKGSRIAILAIDVETGDQNIWIWDDVRKNLFKLTFDESGKMTPVWTPDGKKIAFYSNREGGGIYWKNSDATGEVEKVASDPDRILTPYSWSRDGKSLVVQEVVSQTNVDLSMLSMEGDRKRIPLLQTEYVEGQPKVSPDGKWIAYASNESGRNEICVRPFPEVEKGKWPVSTNGGSCPLWSPDGRELYYLGDDNSVMAVSVETSPTFGFGVPRILFQSRYVGFSVNGGTPWDIHPEGDRFLMMKEPGTDSAGDILGSSRRINIVLNWSEELKKRVPFN
jgi:serine/threonine-protein kinase